MVRYRRNFVEGGTFFFTVALADRRSTTLVDHVAALRTAVRTTRWTLPFVLDAAVVLPDHLHVLMTMPPDDADFSNRLRLVKRRFTTSIEKAGVVIPRHRNGDYALWQRRFWKRL